MKKILHNTNAVLTKDDGSRFLFLQLPDGQVVEVDVNLYSEEELDQKMKEFNLDADEVDLHGYIGPGTTEEKVEVGFFSYFGGYKLKVIESAEELKAAMPGHEEYWKAIQKGLDNGIVD